MPFQIFQDLYYSIILDFGELGNFLFDALDKNFEWIAIILGVKIGLTFLRDSVK